MRRPFRTRDVWLGFTWGVTPGWYTLSLWDKWMKERGALGGGREVRSEKFEEGMSCGESAELGHSAPGACSEEGLQACSAREREL